MSKQKYNLDIQFKRYNIFKFDSQIKRHGRWASGGMHSQQKGACVDPVYSN